MSFFLDDHKKTSGSVPMEPNDPRVDAPAEPDGKMEAQIDALEEQVKALTVEQRENKESLDRVGRAHLGVRDEYRIRFQELEQRVDELHGGRNERLEVGKRTVSLQKQIDTLKDEVSMTLSKALRTAENTASRIAMEHTATFMDPIKRDVQRLEVGATGNRLTKIEKKLGALVREREAHNRDIKLLSDHGFEHGRSISALKNEMKDHTRAERVRVRQLGERAMEEKDTQPSMDNVLATAPVTESTAKTLARAVGTGIAIGAASGFTGEISKVVTRKLEASGVPKELTESPIFQAVLALAMPMALHAVAQNYAIPQRQFFLKCSSLAIQGQAAEQAQIAVAAILPLFSEILALPEREHVAEVIGMEAAE